MTWVCILESLSFPLLIVVTGLIALVTAAAIVCLRWVAKPVHFASTLQFFAASERKMLIDLKETSASVTPVQTVSTDKGELVI